MTTPAKPTNRPPRFVNLAGALVEVFRHAHPQSSNVTIHAYAWRCLGCDLTGAQAPWRPEDTQHPTSKLTACERANAHAASCRAIPRDDASRCCPTPGGSVLELGGGIFTRPTISPQDD